MTVTFSPTAAQAYTGNITVTGNQASGTNTIAVSGTGGTLATFTLSGIVTETPPTTSTALAGVRVAFVDGANAGKSATTGADGRYQITGVVNGGYTVSRDAGWVHHGLTPVGINGNTTLDFRLDPLTPRTQFGPGQYRIDVRHSRRPLLQRSQQRLPLLARARFRRHARRSHRRHRDQLRCRPMDHRSARDRCGIRDRRELRRLVHDAAPRSC